MKSMFETVDSIGERLVKATNAMLLEKNEIDVRSLCAKYTSDVIGNVAFGLECKCEF